MRKLFILAVIAFVLSSCFHHGNDLSITISDDEDEYEMDAHYQKRKTHDVEVYLNEHLLEGPVTIRNKRGERIILDDNTKFSLRSYPGRLNIRINKTENSDEAYEKITVVCEDLKDIMDDN